MEFQIKENCAFHNRESPFIHIGFFIFRARVIVLGLDNVPDLESYKLDFIIKKEKKRK